VQLKLSDLKSYLDPFESLEAPRCHRQPAVPHLLFAGINIPTQTKTNAYIRRPIKESYATRSMMPLIVNQEVPSLKRNIAF
jgi:hypothetical protein